MKNLFMVFLFLIFASCQKQIEESPRDIQPVRLSEIVKLESVQTAIRNRETFTVPFPDDANRDPDFEGCKCFARVVNVDNTPQANGRQWSLIKLVNPTSEEWTIDGLQRITNGVEIFTWWLSPMGYIDIPTNFFEITPLDPSDPNNVPAPDGIFYNHMFYQVTGVANAPGFSIDLEVNCYIIDRMGNATYTKNRLFTFNWEDGISTGDGDPLGIFYRAHFIDLSCYDIPLPPIKN